MQSCDVFSINKLRLQRTNTVISLNVVTGSWQNVVCTGDIPPPRTYHAACAVDNYMFIHGGEGQQNTVNSNTVKFQNETKKPKQVRPNTDSLESNVNRSDCSHEDKYCGMSMNGVCPGDTLGGRIGAAINVKLFRLLFLVLL